LSQSRFSHALEFNYNIFQLWTYLAGPERAMSFEVQLPFADQEPSVLEYARYHGLSYDPAHDDDDEFDLKIIAAASSVIDNDDANGTTIDLVVDTGLLDEKLILDSDARAVLAAIIQSQQPSEVYPFELDIRRTRYVRLEEPLLFTDNEYEVKQYLTAKIAAQTELEIDLDKLPNLFTINEETDESLAWPKKYHTLAAEYPKRIADEKIRVPKAAALYLHQVCQPQDTHEHVCELFESELKYKRVCQHWYSC